VTQNKKQIFSLGQGTYFGEVEIFDKIPQRYCFCQAKQQTLLLICHKDDFLKALKDFPKLEAQMKRTAEMRRQKIVEEYTLAQEDMGTEQDILYKTTDYINKLLLNRQPQRFTEATFKRTTHSSRPYITSRSHLTKITEESEKAGEESAGLYPNRKRLPTDPPLLEIKEDLFPKESLGGSHFYHHHNIHKEITEREYDSVKIFPHRSCLY